MKIRMLEGHYGREEMGSDADYFLEPVSFPMQQTLPHYLDQGEEEVEISDEEELRRWAEEVFVEYEIWDMEVPLAACRDTDIAYDLENAAGRLENDAHELRKEPLEGEIVQEYYEEARRLRDKASLLSGGIVAAPTAHTGTTTA